MTGGEDGEDAKKKAYRMLGMELCVTRGRSHVFMELMHMRSQLRHSRYDEVKPHRIEGQNQLIFACCNGGGEIKSRHTDSRTGVG